MENEIDQVTGLVSRLSIGVDGREYREFLKDLIEELKTMLEAAEND